jgi:hypothetical protein
VLQEAIEKLRKVSARDRFGLDMDGSGKGSSKDDGANGSHAGFSFAQQSLRIDEEVEVEEDSAKADTSSVTPPPTQLQVRRTSEGDKQLLRDEPKFSILAYLKGLSCAKAPRGRAPHGTAHQYTYWRGLYGLAPSQSFLEHGVLCTVRLGPPGKATATRHVLCMPCDCTVRCAQVAVSLLP